MERRRSTVPLTLLHRLHTAGFMASFAETTLRQLGMNPGRIARLVEKTEAKLIGGGTIGPVPGKTR